MDTGWSVAGGVGNVCCLRRTAFTLVEMLVVISIISVLAALLLPSLQMGLAMSKTVDCANLQRQLYIGIMQFTDDKSGIMPIAKFNHSVNAAYATEMFPPLSQLSNNVLGFSYPSGRNLLMPYIKMPSMSCPIDPSTPQFNTTWDWWQPKSKYLLVQERFSICYRNPWGSDNESRMARVSSIKMPGRLLMMLENDIGGTANTNTCGKGYNWGVAKFSYSHNGNTGSNAMYCDGHTQFLRLDHPTVFAVDYKNNYLHIPGQISEENWK